MKIAYLIVAASLLAGTAAHARPSCRRSAINAAKLSAVGYKKLFDITLAEETPELITFEVTLADVLPDPNVTSTIEVTLAKVTCAIIADPIQK